MSACAYRCRCRNCGVARSVSFQLIRITRICHNRQQCKQKQCVTIFVSDVVCYYPASELPAASHYSVAYITASSTGYLALSKCHNRHKSIYIEVVSEDSFFGRPWRVPLHQPLVAPGRHRPCVAGTRCHYRKPSMAMYAVALTSVS